MTLALLKEALSHYGLAETPGPSHNPAIIEMSKVLGYPFDSEQVSWCGIFMAYCAKRSGLPYPDAAYRARKWVESGFGVPAPEIGDICVFWRDVPTGWEGHVGLFINWTDWSRRYLNVLGGNQSDKVTISTYEASHVLGFRRLG